MDAIEARHGTSADQDPDHWVLDDDLWHASTGFNNDAHLSVCGDLVATPVEWVTEDLRHIPDEHDAPVCRDCVAALEDGRAKTVPDDATFDRASELRADGGVTEGELIERAVREAVTLLDAGDSIHVAVGYVVDEHGLGHRRDDVLERVRDQRDDQLVTDGGRDQDEEQLKRMSVSFETESGRTAALETDVSDWLSWDITNCAQYHDLPGYRDGFVEIGFTVDKWGNTGHTVVDFTPEQLRTFLEGLAETIGCEVVDTEDDQPTVATDGGRNLERRGRGAFLSGDAHWCDICSRPFERIDELANHDCQPVRTDGGPEGMECHSCERTHANWDDAGSYAVDGGHHAGIIERWECGHCSSITEGGRR